MKILLTNEPTSEVNSDKVWVDAICIYCNKRFTSMRSASMHLKGIANRHAVNFVNRGKYDNKTGLKQRGRSELNLT